MVGYDEDGKRDEDVVGKKGTSEMEDGKALMARVPMTRSLALFSKESTLPSLTFRSGD